MKITYPMRDYVTINKYNVDNFRGHYKKHLIRLDFNDPTEEDVLYVFSTYPDTNRFIISNNIRFYNDIFRNTTKKYYVENTTSDHIISFFKRNNKCILNLENLTPKERQFILEHLIDVLQNLEVIIMSKEDLFRNEEILRAWNGNVLLAGTSC